MDTQMIRQDKTLQMSKNWTQTLGKIKTAKEARQQAFEFNKSVLQIKLYKNVIMKHNVR